MTASVLKQDQNTQKAKGTLTLIKQNNKFETYKRTLILMKQNNKIKTHRRFKRTLILIKQWDQNTQNVKRVFIVLRHYLHCLIKTNGLLKCVFNLLCAKFIQVHASVCRCNQRMSIKQTSLLLTFINIIN